MTYFSTTLSPSDPAFVVSKDMGVWYLTFQTSSTGACNFTGSARFGTVAPSAVNISNGAGLTLTGAPTATPIDGVTITCTTGTVDLIIGF